MEHTYTDLSGKKHMVKHSVADSIEQKDEKAKRISRELCEIFIKSALSGKG